MGRHIKEAKVEHRRDNCCIFWRHAAQTILLNCIRKLWQNFYPLEFFFEFCLYFGLVL